MIDVKHLTKRFGQFTAVNGITFSVAEKEIFGLLGPNGAGKTTTIRCLLTLLPITSGAASVAGIDVTTRPQQVREVSGYVPQDVSVDGDLTGFENLLFYAELYHVPRSERRQRIDDVMAFMGLTEKAGGLARFYSGGLMRRLEIAQVLVNRPRVLFLDEPSIGLDPVAKRVVWEYINRLRDEFGATILLTTHDMNEADRLCDRLAIMNRGQIAVTGTPQELKAGLGGDVVSIVSADAGCRSALQNIGYKLMPQTDAGTCDLVIDNGERQIPEILEQLRGRGVNPEAVSLKQGTLDDVFLKYVGQRIGEAEAKVENVRAVRLAARKHGR